MASESVVAGPSNQALNPTGSTPVPAFARVGVLVLHLCFITAYRGLVQPLGSAATL